MNSSFPLPLCPFAPLRLCVENTQPRIAQFQSLPEKQLVTQFGNGRDLVRKVTSRRFPVVRIAQILLVQDLLLKRCRLAPNVVSYQIS